MEYEVEERGRLDKFLAQVMPEHSRTKLTRLIDAGAVLVDGHLAKPSFALEPGMVVSLTEEPTERAAHDLTPSDLPLDVVFEDDQLLVVNKPRGLATHPALSLKEPSLVNALLGRQGIQLSSTGEAWRPGIVHRLDKETTGLIMVAKTDSAHVSLAEQVATRTAERQYLAVLAGEPERDAWKVEAPIGRDPKNRQKMAVVTKGKHAVTHFKKIKRINAGTVVRCRLETGRTHQIRVHALFSGHPVLGDVNYAPKPYNEGPLQLHATYLAFNHPVSGDRLEFEVPPPADFFS